MGREWPAHSPILNPLDYFLWGCLIHYDRNNSITLKQTSGERSEISSQSWLREISWTFKYELRRAPILEEVFLSDINHV